LPFLAAGAFSRTLLEQRHYEVLDTIARQFINGNLADRRQDVDPGGTAETVIKAMYDLLPRYARVANPQKGGTR